jgi:Tfp pilus assembly protein PilN
VSEIDLIPREYRRERQRESVLRTLAGGVVGVLVVGVSAIAGLALASSRVQGQVESLQAARRLSDQQNVELENLRAERARLEQQWSRLQALRGGGGDVDGLFLLIDRTLPAGDLWFDRWELRLDAAVPAAGEPAGAPPARAAQMTITGQAREYGALSEFVRNLYGASEVADVHLGRTGLRRYTTTSIVDFELAVVLGDDA